MTGMCAVDLDISIHALHEESDPTSKPCVTMVLISIHALHEESDQQTIDDYGAFVEFQSTLSMRRATSRRLTITVRSWNFNPRSP